MKIRIHFKLIWFLTILKFLLIIGIPSYFWLKIYPLLNPRLLTPADFADNVIVTEILCRWEEKVSNVEIKKLRNMKITAYTNRPEETDSTPNTSASNRTVYEGSCAVSRDLYDWLIKFGYKIYIEEMKKSFVVECLMAEKLKDGTPIKRTIDIFKFQRHLLEAQNFRILNATVQVTIPREREKKK